MNVPEPSKRRTVALFAGVVILAAVVVAILVVQTENGPSRRSGTPPAITISVTRAAPGNAVVPPDASLSPHDTLQARVHLEKPAKVSLVHINVGHGMEALMLNEELAAGDHVLEAEGKPVTLSLDGLSGAQKLAAIVSLRDLSQDEALSAGRGIIPEGVGVSSQSFEVKP